MPSLPQLLSNPGVWIIVGSACIVLLCAIVAISRRHDRPDQRDDDGW